MASFTQKSATWDEPIHLTAGYLALADGDYRVDPSHPPFLRMWAAVPLLARDGVRADTSEIDRVQDDAWLQDAYRFASQFLYRQQDADRLLYPARFMVVLCGIGLGILVFFWAREWLGFWPAVLALACCAIEPNLAAHARLVTTDLGASLFIFGTVFALWRTCRRPNRWNIAALATCFALAFVTKFSAVVLVPIVLVLLVVAVTRRMSISLRTAAHIVVLLTVSTFVAVWAVYGFRYAPSPSDAWLLQLQDAPIVVERAPGLAKVVAWVDAQRVLPNAFTQGFLMSQASARQTAYLSGAYSQDGWWYYFPVAFLVKTQSALLVLVAIGAVLLVRTRRPGLVDEWFIVLPVGIYLAFAMASGVNIGIRHILPIYPFLILIAASAAKALIAWRRPIGRLALAAVMAYSCTRYVLVYPDMLTFFNVFAGGPDNGVTYLADSNLDWGQDLKPLKKWMATRNVEHINLAYFGTADPRYYGIRSTYLPGTPSFIGMMEKPVLPGYVAISATHLSGVYLEPSWRLFYAGFRGLEPVDTIGHSIRIYWVDHWPDPDPNGRDIEAPVDDVLAHESLGDDLFFELNWTDQAVAHYEAALDRDPDDVAVIGKLGVALLNTGESDAAAATFQRAAALDPDNGQTRFRLATALLQSGRDEEAVEHAEAATRLRPDDPIAHDLLGVVLARIGRLGPAESSFEKALQLAPANEHAREHLRQLRRSAS